MPLSRDELRHAITDRLHYLAIVNQVHALWRLSDAGQPLDRVLAAVFDALFGGRFAELAQRTPDCPADLGDPQQRIAAIVTNHASSARVLDAHDKVIKHGLGRDYDRLILFFLRAQKPVLSRRIRKNSAPPVVELWDLDDIARRLQEVDDLPGLSVALEVLKSHTPGFEGATAMGPAVWKNPPEAERLIGRLNDTLKVRQLLAKHHLVAITAPSGRGKSALAAALLADLGPPPGYAGPFPRRLLQHDFGVQPGYDAALAGLLTQAGHDIRDLDLEELEMLARPLLEDPATYLFLDGGEHASELPRLLELASHSHILLATKNPTLPNGAARFELPSLAVAEAGKLMALIATRGSLTKPTPAHLDLARFLDGHALACTLAGHILHHTGWSVSKLIGELKSGGLESLSGPQRETASVFCLLEQLWSMVAASHPGSSSVWVLLALGALSPLPVSFLIASSGLTEHELAPNLDTLQRLSIARATRDGGDGEPLWQLAHSTIQDFALHSDTPAADMVPQLYPRWRDAWLDLLDKAWRTRNLPGGNHRFDLLLPHFSALLRTVQSHETTASCRYPLALTQVAVLSHRHGRLSIAATMYKQNFAWCQAHLGASHASTLNAANNLAVLHHSQGDLPQAEQLYRHVLVEQERTLGPEHPDTLGTLNNLATVRIDQGHLAEAEGLYRRVLEALIRTLGAEHPDTITCLGNLASVLRKHDPVRAERLYRRALVMKEKTLGPDHPDTQHCLHTLAVLLHNIGDLASAEALFSRALADRERMHGRDHPRTLLTVNRLGVVLEAQGQTAQAAALYDRAATSARARLPAHDPRRQGFERNLARINALCHATTL